MDSAKYDLLRYYNTNTSLKSYLFDVKFGLIAIAGYFEVDEIQNGQVEKNDPRLQLLQGNNMFRVGVELS